VAAQVGAGRELVVESWMMERKAMRRLEMRVVLLVAVGAVVRS
jgi:hypothetical protein